MGISQLSNPATKAQMSGVRDGHQAQRGFSLVVLHIISPVWERTCQVSRWGAWGLELLIGGRCVNRSRNTVNAELEGVVHFFHFPRWVGWWRGLDM